MKKRDILTILSIVLVVIICLILWIGIIFKPKSDSKLEPRYSNRIIITNNVGDTLLDKRIESSSPMKPDSLELFLIKR
jgi:hypothetical protein